jgi:hypothetical protein
MSKAQFVYVVVLAAVFALVFAGMNDGGGLFR